MGSYAFKRLGARSADAPGAGAGSSDRPRADRYLIAIGVGAGLIARAVSLWIAPQSSYLPDHISNMGWGTYAVELGPWRIYDLPANQPVIIRVQDPRSGRTGETVGVNAHACNYPPLGAYLYWLQGLVWHALDHTEVTLRPPPRLTRRIGITAPVTSRVVDTHASRFADALPGIILDFFLAWGVAMLVRALRPSGGSPRREALAFALTLVAPPIFLDSAFWNQADSWITCLLVWTVVYLMRERMVAAGLVYGAALMTKPQAILLAPVLVYVFFALRFMPGGSWGRALGILKSAAVALVVVAVIAAPFMIADAQSDANPDGAFRWFKRSYVGTIGDERYARTTLNAFNLWWLDLLGKGTPRGGGDLGRFLDAKTPLLGISKATVGNGLLGLGVVLAWVLCARKWKWTRPSWPVCTYVILLAAFTLPTSVHERYIYYCIPFAIALAAHAPAWIFPMLAVLTVGTFEMTSFKWLGLWSRQLYTPGNAALPGSASLAGLTILSLLYSYIVLIPRAGRRH